MAALPPPFPMPVPVLDPTGGGIAGDARYIDVNGDGFLSPSDAVDVITFLNAAPGPLPLVGEGEGEGEAAPAMAAAPPAAGSAPAGSAPAAPDSPLLAGPLLVSPDIVIEERTSLSRSLADWLEARAA